MKAMNMEDVTPLVMQVEELADSVHSIRQVIKASPGAADQLLALLEAAITGHALSLDALAGGGKVKAVHGRSKPSGHIQRTRNP